MKISGHPLRCGAVFRVKAAVPRDAVDRSDETVERAWASPSPAREVKGIQSLWKRAWWARRMTCKLHMDPIAIGGGHCGQGGRGRWEEEAKSRLARVWRDRTRSSG